jgi:proteasome lid subunit RPN8/RPN11
MIARLILTVAQLDQMIAHLTGCLPEEACGLIAGTGERAQRVLPVENQLHSPARFKMAPAGQWAAFQEIETAGLDLLAIFHSHPHGPSHPSSTDIAEFFYPDTAVLIASPRTEPPDDRKLVYHSWQIGAFQIVENDFITVKLDLLVKV